MTEPKSHSQSVSEVQAQLSPMNLGNALAPGLSGLQKLRPQDPCGRKEPMLPRLAPRALPRPDGWVGQQPAVLCNTHHHGVLVHLWDGALSQGVRGWVTGWLQDHTEAPLPATVPTLRWQKAGSALPSARRLASR